jgi:hypothetical protein
MPAIGKPPMTHVHTSGVGAGATEAYTFDPKTNKIYIRSTAAWKFAHGEPVTPPAVLGTAGDGAGINVSANAWKEITVSVGTDRVAGIQILIENSGAGQVYEIEVEE